MDNGLYKASFQTPRGAGHGVIYLNNGKVHGGDSMMFYVGEFQLSGDQFSAQLEVDTHSRTPSMASVLGAQKATLNLEGTSKGTTAVLKGTSPQAPGISFTARIDKISD